MMTRQASETSSFLLGNALRRQSIAALAAAAVLLGGCEQRVGEGDTAPNTPAATSAAAAPKGCIKWAKFTGKFDPPIASSPYGTALIAINNALFEGKKAPESAAVSWKTVCGGSDIGSFTEAMISASGGKPGPAMRHAAACAPAMANIEIIRKEITNPLQRWEEDIKAQHEKGEKGWPDANQQCNSLVGTAVPNGAQGVQFPLPSDNLKTK
jgi:hypothetical protein